MGGGAIIPVKKKTAFAWAAAAAARLAGLLRQLDAAEDTGTARQVRQAKKEGLIDQFIYASVSASYLVALMDTL